MRGWIRIASSRLPDQAAVVERVGEPRIELDRLSVILERLGGIIARRPQEGTIVIGLGILRIEAQRLGVLGVRAREIVLAAVGDAAVVVDHGEIVAAIFARTDQARAGIRPRGRFGRIIAAQVGVHLGNGAAGERGRHGEAEQGLTVHESPS
jgi:hypothetical protein